MKLPDKIEPLTQPQREAVLDLTDQRDGAVTEQDLLLLGLFSAPANVRNFDPDSEVWRVAAAVWRLLAERMVQTGRRPTG